MRHRTSALPSPLKSPVPAICQLGLTAPKFSEVKPPEPFEFQSSTSPLDELRHRMSEMPLPVKSFVTGTNEIIVPPSPSGPSTKCSPPVVVRLSCRTLDPFSTG